MDLDVGLLNYCVLEFLRLGVDSLHFFGRFISGYAYQVDVEVKPQSRLEGNVHLFLGLGIDDAFRSVNFEAFLKNLPHLREILFSFLSVL